MDTNNREPTTTTNGEAKVSFTRYRFFSSSLFEKNLLFWNDFLSLVLFDTALLNSTKVNWIKALFFFFQNLTSGVIWFDDGSKKVNKQQLLPAIQEKITNLKNPLQSGELFFSNNCYSFYKQFYVELNLLFLQH